MPDNDDDPFRKFINNSLFKKEIKDVNVGGMQFSMGADISDDLPSITLSYQGDMSNMTAYSMMKFFEPIYGNNPYLDETVVRLMGPGPEIQYDLAKPVNVMLFQGALNDPSLDIEMVFMYRNMKTAPHMQPPTRLAVAALFNLAYCQELLAVDYDRAIHRQDTFIENMIARHSMLVGNPGDYEDELGAEIERFARAHMPEDDTGFSM